MTKAYEVQISENEYEEMLNDTYETVEICGMTYEAGYALKEVDPVAFRCGLADEPLWWACDECRTEYEDEDEANECCAPEEE